MEITRVKGFARAVCDLCCESWEINQVEQRGEYEEQGSKVIFHLQDEDYIYHGGSIFKITIEQLGGLVPGDDLEHDPGSIPPIKEESRVVQFARAMVGLIGNELVCNQEDNEVGQDNDKTVFHLWDEGGFMDDEGVVHPECYFRFTIEQISGSTLPWN